MKLLKEISRSNIFFKKFLLAIRMYFFKMFKNENSDLKIDFKHQIGKFNISIRQLQTGKTFLCGRKSEIKEKSLVPGISLASYQKVHPCEFSFSFSEEDNDKSDLR
jgi:hypothetical protein